MAPRVVEAGFTPPVHGWFTTRVHDDVAAPAVGVAGNMSPHRPHEMQRFVADRAAVAHDIGYPVETWHAMRQVHGADVGIIDAETPLGHVGDAVDALITDLVDRPLVVHVADCVPVLLAGDRDVAVAHAGRNGVAAGIVETVVDRLHARGNADVAAVIGPAIGGCCYEVPAELRDAIAVQYPQAWATTTWGTPALDLAAAVIDVLASAGIAVSHVASCTRCDPQQRWFSHRRDPATGRFAGIVVRAAGGRA